VFEVLISPQRPPRVAANPPLSSDGDCRASKRGPAFSSLLRGRACTHEPPIRALTDRWFTES